MTEPVEWTPPDGTDIFRTLVEFIEALHAQGIKSPACIELPRHRDGMILITAIENSTAKDFTDRLPSTAMADEHGWISLKLFTTTIRFPAK